MLIASKDREKSKIRNDIAYLLARLLFRAPGFLVSIRMGDKVMAVVFTPKTQK